MATFTDVWSWSLVPENADPAWPLFDRLIGEIDYTLGVVRQRQLALHPHTLVTHAWSARTEDTAQAGAAIQSVYTPLSLAPRGAAGAQFQVSSGALVQFDVHLRAQPRVGEPIVGARLIVHPGSLNITGDSAWAGGSTLNPNAQDMNFTATASLGSGTYVAILEVQERNDADGTSIDNTPASILVYQYERPS